MSFSSLLAFAAPQDCHRLNGPLPLGPDGAVVDFAFSQEGRRVVYRVLESSGSQVELFSAIADGSAPIQSGPHPDPRPVRLNGRMATGGDVLSFQIRGRWVVYLADERTDEAIELFAVPIDGSSSPLRLNADLVEGGDVSAFAIAPDASRVVFRADVLVDERSLLFSVPIGGGAPIVLNTALVANGDVHEFAIDPGSSRVVYRATQLAPDVFELFSAPIDVAVSAVRLNDTLPSGVDVHSLFSIGPDGSRAVFSAGSELFSVPTDGRALPSLLNAAYAGPHQITSDGRTVVFKTVGALVAIPVTGGAHVILSTSGAGSFRVSPDSQRVVFWDRDELHSARIDGRGGPVLLHAPQPGELYEVAVTPDGLHVLFSVFASGFTLHVASIDGSSPALFLDSLAALCAIPQFQASRDGTRVVYRKRSHPDGSLWSTRVDGSATPTVLLSEDLICVPYAVGASTDLVAWLGSSGQLFTRPIDGRTAPLQIHADFPDVRLTGAVGNFAVGARHAVYAADQEADDLSALYSVLLPAGGSPVRLGELQPSPPPDGGTLLVASGGTRVIHRAWTLPRVLLSVAIDGSESAALPLSDFPVRSFQLGPDDESVLFLDESRRGLYRAPADGSEAAVLLSGSIVSGGVVELDYRPSSDGVRAVFRGDLDTDDVVELYTGDGLARTRIASMQAFGDVRPGFALAPDGQRVLYIADQRTDERFELFSVPAAGGTPVVLSGPMVAGGDVDECLITHDGTTAIFLADAESSTPFVYSVRTDGSSLPVRLCSPTRVVYPGVQLDPHGTRVVFRQSVGSGTLVLSAPVDGSQAAVRLNGVERSVTSFAISPDGTRVVYLANDSPFVNGPTHVYACPIDGSSAPLRLNGEITVTRDVVAFETSPDSTHVAYRIGGSDAELFAVPIDRAREPQSLTCPVLFLDERFSWTPDSSAVVYRAIVQDFSPELFTGFVERPEPRRHRSNGRILR